MAAELLATGTAAANSADLVVPAGQTAKLFLKVSPAVTDIDAGSLVFLQFKSSASGYSNQYDMRAKTPVDVSGPVTLRAYRPVQPAGTPGVGVEYELG